MEGTYRVYLPSNASMHIFPNNKPSDYQIQLNPPLELTGEWEVAVENVCYDSAIGNDNEKADIILTAQDYEEVSMNDTFDFPYVLTKEGRWNYDWLQIESNYYGADHGKMMTSLNEGNMSILKNKDQKVYEFHFINFHGAKFMAFASFSSGFAMRLTNEMAAHIGFGTDVHLSNDFERIANRKKVDHSQHMDKTKYKIQIFDENVIECEDRIILKKRGEKPLSLAALVKQWNETVGKKYGEKSRHSHSKFIVEKSEHKLTIKFSPDIRHVIKHYSPVIGYGTFWGSHPYTISKNATEEWWVEIYRDRIKKQRRNKEL